MRFRSAQGPTLALPIRPSTAADRPGRRLGFARGLAATFAAAFALWPAVAGSATLVYTNDLFGEIEPCGCRSNPLGGMARMANYLAKFPDPSRLLVDAGDLLFATSPIPPSLEKQAMFQADSLVGMMNAVGLQAAVPGEKDFALGWKAFQKIRAKAKFRYLAANARGFAPSAVFPLKKRGGGTLRVGVLGLLGEEIEWPKEIRLSPSIPAARREAESLRKNGADLVVALTHQGHDKDVALGEAVASIDIIVGAHTQSFLQNPPKAGNATIYQSSFRNQYLGVLRLDPAEGEPAHELVGLDVNYDSPSGTPSEMDKRVSEFKAGVARINESEAKASPSATRGYQTFPKCSECHWRQFDFWRKTAHAGAFRALYSAKQSMNKECLGCHTVGLAKTSGWRNAGQLLKLDGRWAEHAEIAAFLESIRGAPLDGAVDVSAFTREPKHDSDPSLASPAPSASSSARTATLRGALALAEVAFAPVQCENCHQGDVGHPFEGKMGKQVSREACLQCHTRERAPGWHKEGKPVGEIIEAKRAMVACPAGDFPPDGASMEPSGESSGKPSGGPSTQPLGTPTGPP